MTVTGVPWQHRGRSQRLVCPEAESGRGPWLVSRLADRFRVVPRADGGPGRTVRAELPL
ncbi:hypothetical protein [Streptomyces pseudogriseolus]|uniref:hypothetical protein n=1 Tax=Streptomyces pseudogriseolus TaxID=36817 RepID=UPI003FA258D2